MQPKVEARSLACVQEFPIELLREVRAGAENKKVEGGGEGRGKEETLACKPHDSGKRHLIFYGLVHL